MHRARCLANKYYFNLIGQDFNVLLPDDIAEQIIGKDELKLLNNREV